MQFILDESEKNLRAESPEHIDLDAQGAQLRLNIPAGEVLGAASLTLERSSHDTRIHTPGDVSPAIAADAEDFTGITWITADWGTARTTCSFAIRLAAAPEADPEFAGQPVVVKIRVRVARGGSAWYSPPGPHTFDYSVDTANTSSWMLEGRFPDTVADRMMLEFLRQDGGPRSVALDPTDPLSLSFAPHALAISVSVGDGRPFFWHPGGVVEPVIIDNLVDAIAQTMAGEITDTEVVLFLGAEVAGRIGLSWSFESLRILRQFSDGQDRRELELAWGEELRETLEVQGHLEQLSVTLASAPARERIRLEPKPDGLAIADANLCRALYENAQAFAFETERPVIGVDLWARSLTTRTRVRATLAADEHGLPASAALADHAVAEAILDDPAAPGRGPRWLTLNFESPIAIPAKASLWWLVVTVEEGELLWFLGRDPPPSAAGIQYRRDRAAWLPRTLDATLVWGLTRVRVADDKPPSPPEVALMLIPPSGGDGDRIPLTVDEEGRIDWVPVESAPWVDRVELACRSPVATRITLSALRLAYAEAAPGA